MTAPTGAKWGGAPSRPRPLHAAPLPRGPIQIGFDEDAPRPPAHPPPRRVGKAAGAPPGSVAPAHNEPPTESNLVVYSTSDADELGINSLISGDYTVGGINHGRKYFSKVMKDGSASEVFLYYWDQRNGPTFSGWWFGNEVGGAQVWLQNREQSLMPPRTGWTWRDGQVRDELMVVPAEERPEPVAEDAGWTDLDSFSELEAYSDQSQSYGYQSDPVEVISEEVTPYLPMPSSQPDENSEWTARVQLTASEVETAERDVVEALEMAKSVSSAKDSTRESIVRALDFIVAQVDPLQEVQRHLASEGAALQQAAPAGTLAGPRAELAELGQRVRKLQTSVKAEHQRLEAEQRKKAAQEVEEKQQAERMAKQRVVEAKQLEQLDELLSSCEEKMSTVDDEVEMVTIAATPLEVDAIEDLQGMMLDAVTETEKRCKTALAAVQEAQRLIGSKLVQARRLRITTRDVAKEFGALQAKMSEAQTKLKGYQTVRQDFDLRIKSRKMVAELTERLSTAELEVEKADMARAAASTGGTEAVKDMQAAFNKAQGAISQASRLIESKAKTTPKGIMRDELEKLLERAKLSQEKVDDGIKVGREMKAQAAADALLKEVSDQENAMDAELQLMDEMEEQFKGIGEDSVDLNVLVADADQLNVRVRTSLTTTQGLLSKRLLEAGRTTDGPMVQVRDEIVKLQKRLAEAFSRLQAFSVAASDIKRRGIVKEAESEIATADGELQKLRDIVQSIGAEGDGPSDRDIAEGSEGALQVGQAERTVQAAILSARKSILQRASELRKATASGEGGHENELVRLQARIQDMQKELTQLRNASQDAEERVKVRKQLTEFFEVVRIVENDVEQVSSMVGTLDEEVPEGIDDAEKSATAARTKLSATQRMVALKLKSAQGILKEELGKLESKLRTAGTKLDDADATVGQHRESLRARGFVAECAESVEQAEIAVQKAMDSEMPFITGVEELTSSEGMDSMQICEAAIKAAVQALDSADTLASERLATVQQTKTAAAEARSQELQAHKERLVANREKIAELQKETKRRKRDMQQQLTEEKFTKVEGLLQKLSEALTKLGEEEGGAELTAEDAAAVCEELGNAEQDAEDALTDAKDCINEQLAQAKGLSKDQAKPLVAELSKWQSKLTQFQGELAKLAKDCTAREERFVAQRLEKEVFAHLDRLQSDAEDAYKLASSITSVDKSKLLASLHWRKLAEVMSTLIKTSGEDVDALFAKITSSDKATAEDFTGFVEGLKDVDGLSLSKQQVLAAFTSVAGPDAVLSVDSFRALFRERCVCGFRAPLTEHMGGGAEVGMLEPGEVVEVLQRSKDAQGLEHIECILVRNGRTVWVSAQGANGDHLLPADGDAGQAQSIVAYIGALHARCVEVTEYVEQKRDGISSVQRGPLADVKAKLLQQKMKISVVQMKLEQLKKRTEAALSTALKQWEAELVRARETRAKEAIEKSMKSATQVVDEAERCATEVLQGVKSGSVFRRGESDLDVSKLAGVKGDTDKALEALAKAKVAVDKAMEDQEAMGGKNPSHASVRMELMKLQTRTQSMDRKCRLAANVVSSAFAQATRKAELQARSVLRTAISKLGKSSDDLFEEISGGKDEMTEEQFTSFVKSLKDVDLEGEQMTQVFRELSAAHGMRKPEFALITEEYYTCSRPIAITKDFKIDKGGSLRMLEVGEVLLVLEGPQEDNGNSLSRVRGRAVKDGAEGWVTLKGNKGTPFLSVAPKPGLKVVKDLPLCASRDGTSQRIRQLFSDEIVEVLEGPQVTVVEPPMVLRGTATKDGAKGWVTLVEVGEAGASSGSSASNAVRRSDRVHKCTATIAMTDDFDIHACKVVRKVAKDEILELLVDADDAEKESAAGLSRRRFRALTDGVEGWVTLKGSHGTSYLEASTKHYVMERAAPLYSGKQASPKVVRQLERGEFIEAEGPPSASGQAQRRQVAHVRAISDCLQGWVSWTEGDQGAPVLSATFPGSE